MVTHGNRNPERTGDHWAEGHYSTDGTAMLYSLSYPKEPRFKETMNRTANTAVVFLMLPFKTPCLFHVEFSS